MPQLCYDGVAQSQEVEVVGIKSTRIFFGGGCGCVLIEESICVPSRLLCPLPLAEKLYGSSGPELRRSLFSLKQIFQVRPRGGLGVGIHLST